MPIEPIADLPTILNHGLWLMLGMLLLMWVYPWTPKGFWFMLISGALLVVLDWSQGLVLPVVLSWAALMILLVRQPHHWLLALAGLVILVLLAYWPHWVAVGLLLWAFSGLSVVIWHSLHSASPYRDMVPWIVCLLMGMVAVTEFNAWLMLVLAFVLVFWLIIEQSPSSVNESQEDGLWPALLEQSKSNERQRIYRNIHDEVGAVLLQLIYQLDGHEAQAQAKQVMQKIRQAVAETAQYSLTAEDLFTDLAMEAAGRLQLAGIDFSQHFDIDPKINIENHWPIHLSRLVRESISNVLRHAKAKRVVLTVVWRPELKQLIIEDDGLGLKPMKQVGKGMKSMQQRAKQMQAEVHWVKGSLGGTQWVVQWHE